MTYLLLWRIASERANPIAHEMAQCIDYGLFFRTQRANVRYEGMNLIPAERILEGRHSPLTVGNDLSELRIGQLLDYRGTKVRNVHALSGL
jgi:hypothetical protein